MKRKRTGYLQSSWARNRKFNGKIYEYITAYFRKRDAIEKKEFLKRQGWLVRIVKIRDFYVLYGRKK